MSAFIGSPSVYARVYAGMGRDFGQSHAVRRLAAAASEWRHEGEEDMRPAIMRGLYALNVRAVNHRYNEETDETLPEEYQNLRESMITAHEYAKALHCIHYQMSEGTEIPAHALYKALERLMHAVEGHIVGRSPEYAAAAWD